tara:strand:+ start:461 stop:757 length:297 start_codon:yes stop_codon:yes gene_type:complete
MNKKITLYRPGSGSEGIWFEEKWCAHCTKQPLNPSKGGCLLLLHMMCYDTSEEGYPQEIQLINNKPVCLGFKSREEVKRKETWKKFLPKSVQLKLWRK